MMPTYEFKSRILPSLSFSSSLGNSIISDTVLYHNWYKLTMPAGCDKPQFVHQGKLVMAGLDNTSTQSTAS